jgi:hypothetical protein
MGRAWTSDEDAILRELYSKHGKQWSLIASQIENRTASQVAARWEKCLNPKLVKGPFTAAEDRAIEEHVWANGPHRWPVVCAQLGSSRSPKQCRERWFNQLDPKVHQNPWTAEEDRVIFEAYQRIGPKWTLIANELPGRPDNAIKNRWNSSIAKRIMTEGGTRVLGPDQSARKPRPPPTLPNPPMMSVPVTVPLTLSVTMNLPPVTSSGASVPQTIQLIPLPGPPGRQSYFAPILIGQAKGEDPAADKGRVGKKDDEGQKLEQVTWTGFYSPHIFSPACLYSLSSGLSPYSGTGSGGKNVFESNE